MSSRKTIVGGLFVAAGMMLSVLALLSPIPAGAAQDHFNCRASALRLTLPLNLQVEPVAANPSADPCQADSQTLLSFGHELGISTGTLVAKTSDSPKHLYSKAKIENLKLANLLNLVNLSAKAIRANAHASATDRGKCRLRSASSIERLVVLGQEFSSLETPLDLDVKLLGLVVAKLHLNATLGGKHPTIGDPDPSKITQRAVWLHVTDPILQLVLADLVIGEASVDTVGKPCK